jgi:putative transposase
VKGLRLPPRSPNLNAFAERWVRSVKEECLSKLILFGEASLRRALTQFQEHYHSERNHQGKGNVLLFPHSAELPKSRGPAIECRERLGGLLKRPAVPYGSVSGAKNLAFSPRLKRVFSRKFLNRCG